MSGYDDMYSERVHIVSTAGQRTFTAMARQTMAMPEVNSQDELENFLFILSHSGWAYNEEEHMLERFTQLPHVQVGTLGRARTFTPHTVADQDGLFTLDFDGLEAGLARNISNIELVFSDPDSDLLFMARIIPDESLFVMDIDITSMVIGEGEPDVIFTGSPQSEHARAAHNNPFWQNGELGFTGFRLHCNRFNGPWGDNRYYSNHLLVQTMINFTMSDCDFAMGQNILRCINDMIPWADNYCAADGSFRGVGASGREATCSTMTHSPRTFHFRR